MKQISTIVFDLGGVILNLDYQQTENAFIQLGLTQFRELYTQFHANHLFIDLETGKITADKFMEELNKVSPVPLTKAQIQAAWNAMLLDFPPGRLTFLKNLRQQYRTFLLSNTNSIHYNAIQDNYKPVMQAEFPLEDCFDVAYYSHDLGMRKPDQEIYDYVVRENKLIAEQTVFIDDNLINVEGALRAGLQGIHLPASVRIEDLFVDNVLYVEDYFISSKSM